METKGFAECHCKNPEFEIGVCGMGDEKYRPNEDVAQCMNCKGIRKIQNVTDYWFVIQLKSGRKSIMPIPPALINGLRLVGIVNSEEVQHGNE